MSSRGIWDWQLVQIITGLSILLYIGFFAYYGYSEIATREVIRWTARLSFFCFCIAFAANGLHQVMKNSLSFWVLMNRKYWGIAFAISHFIHLLFLGVLQYTFHPVFTVAEHSAIAAGSIAYLFIGFMFLTSFERFSKFLSKKQWTLLHTIGGYWIGGVFMSSYLTRALTEPSHWGYVVVLLLVLGLRIKNRMDRGTKNRS